MHFPEIRGRLGFGCMRLAQGADGKADRALFSTLVDRFLAAGFNYFDTAHVYLDGDSELALRDCLTERYPREAYLLADKLSDSCFEASEDIRPFFERQLAACGVEYFDFYLMHCIVEDNYEKFRRCRGFETAFALKREGKIRHVGFSFHEGPELLERVLKEYPEVEFVQLQINYLDYDTAPVEGKANLEVCARYGKPVIVMEPVKGGKLAALPAAAQEALAACSAGSAASYALRFSANCPQVVLTLSGMNSEMQLEDNLSVMAEAKPLSEKERSAVSEVCRILRAQGMYQCTDCRYCVKGCPQNIFIPRLLFLANNRRAFDDMTAIRKYQRETRSTSPASACVGCGQCESVCPQHLPIRSYLGKISEEFDAYETIIS